MARGILGSSLVRGPRTTGPLARSYRGGAPFSIIRTVTLLNLPRAVNGDKRAVNHLPSG